MDSHIERRQFPRIPMTTVVYVTQDGLEDSIPGHMVDVSLGGMKILTQLAVATGSEITVVVELESGERIEIPAMVVWMQCVEIMAAHCFGIDCMHGIRFTLSPDEIDRILFKKLIT